MTAGYETGYLAALRNVQSALSQVIEEFEKDRAKHITTCSCGNSKILGYTHKLGRTCLNCGLHLEVEE